LQGVVILASMNQTCI